MKSSEEIKAAAAKFGVKNTNIPKKPKKQIHNHFSEELRYLLQIRCKR